MHHKDGTHHGETEQRLHSLPAWRECPYYSAAERAALAMADRLTTEANLDDAEFAELEKYFTKAQIADLALAIAGTNILLQHYIDAIRNRNMPRLEALLTEDIAGDPILRINSIVDPEKLKGLKAQDAASG